MPEHEPRLLGVRAAARELGVHENTVRNWADRGILPVAQLLPGHHRGFRRFDPAEVERLRRQLQRQAARVSA
jgi:DNA-binding transcriptional MerR regulator